MRVQPRYQFETAPITVETCASGKTVTRMSDISGRVVDTYTGMPVGVVSHGPAPNLPNDKSGGYTAICSFPPDGQDAELEPPGGTWGNRFDQAADAIWDRYYQQLPRRERVKRFLWRWSEVEWFLIGTLWGALIAMAVSAAAG